MMQQTQGLSPNIKYVKQSGYDWNIANNSGNTYIKLIQGWGGSVEKSQEGILGILVLDAYRHRTNNTTAVKYVMTKHQGAT